MDRKTFTTLLRGIWLLAVLLPAASLGQETRGSITGRVVDSSGAVIPGVTVRATNLATNLTGSTISSAEGSYEIPYLPPGSYRLGAELAGFKSFVRENVALRMADRLTIEITMSVGEVSERVTVTAETPLLESGTASMGQVIDSRRLSDLPIAHGNPFLLMSLSPGVSFQMNVAFDQPYAPGHTVGYAMDGVRTNRSVITMDGAPNTVAIGRWGAGDLSTGSSPPADMVEEFKVQTANYDASIGHTQGGVTSVTLKSGTNQFHGIAGWSTQRPELNANLFFANKVGQPKSDFQYNRYNLSVGGPIRLPKYDGRDKTFFIYGYEGIDHSYPRGSILTVPTERQRNGDFSELLRLGSQYQIYDPSTRVQLPNGRFQVQPLPNNIIPQSRISPAARNVLNYWALPNAPGTADGTNNLNRTNEPENLKYYNHIGRIDHYFSERHRTFGRVNTYNRYSQHSDWFHTLATGIQEDWLQHAAVLDHIFVVNPRSTLNLRYSVYRLAIGFTPKHPENLGFDLTELGLPKSFADAIPPAVRAFPVFSIQGYTPSVNQYWRLPIQNHTAEAHMNMARGAHALKFGGDVYQFRTFQIDPANTSSGLFEFATDWTRGPFDNSAPAPLGQGLASFMLGLPTGGRVDRNASYAEQSTIYSLYLQDNWRLKPRLTLSLGLRYELEGPLTERFNRSVRGYDFATPNPMAQQVQANYAARPIPEIPASQFRLMGGLTFAGVGGQPRTLWSRDTNNFMPRIGVAYQLSRSTVLRTGWGMFYGPLGTRRGDVIQTGFSRSTQLIPSEDNGLNFMATLENPFPRGIEEPSGAAEGLSTFLGRPVNFFNASPRAALQQRWSFGLQREFARNVLLEVAYVGNHGSQMETSRDYRPLPLQYLSQSPLRDQANIDFLTQPVPNPFYPLLPGTGLAGQNVTRAYLLSSGEYPQFTGLTSTENLGYSWYHSLQVRSERRFAAGWTMNVSYTWSKFMQALDRLNGYQSPLEYVISDQDRPHRLAVSGIWELPFGRGRRMLSNAPSAVDKVIGGWQLQGVYIAQSGQALGFGNALFIGDIHDITLPEGQRKPERWFNTDGFERNAGRQLQFNLRQFPSRLSNVRGDGMNYFDLSALKNTSISESVRLQIRGEMLNALNHAMFANPNTSPTSTAFGTVVGTKGYGRRVQIGLRLLF